MKSRTVVSICLAAAIVLVALADLILLNTGGKTSPVSESPAVSSAFSVQGEEEDEQDQQEELTEQLLLTYFETSYQQAGVYDQPLTLEEMCQAEGEQLEQLLTQDGYDIPDGLEEDYLDWREEEHPYSEDVLFEEIEDIMYATANVNIRASYSAESDRVAGLAAGGSITVTGIGQGQAEGWYRVLYLNTDGGRTVGYVSADYLSETR
ncbi:MAG: SH3 domain-containing protein [Oscillospiraceae bacterium]|nr:SH3 domain-containing protein [Oscillospiraceae bacterium]